MMSLYRCERCGKLYEMGYHGYLSDEEQNLDSFENPLCAETCENSHAMCSDRWDSEHYGADMNQLEDRVWGSQECLVSDMIFSEGGRYPDSVNLWLRVECPRETWENNSEVPRFAVMKVKFKRANVAPVRVNGQGE